MGEIGRVKFIGIKLADPLIPATMVKTQFMEVCLEVGFAMEVREWK